MGYQSERLINNRNLFLMVLEAGKSKIKSPADSYSLPGSRMDVFSLHPHVMEGARELCEVLFYKGTNPACEGSTLTI